MAVLYPNEIINVYIQDVEFTGNIVSVGNDGNYSYDYSNPMQATQSEPSGSLILIYPGTYSMGNLYNSVSNKDSYWRGMGDDVTDVYLRQTLDYGVVLFMGSYNKIILENFRTFGNFDHSELNFNNGTTSTNIYLNKLHLNASAGFGSGYAGVNIVNGSGNIYGTNVDINANVFQLRGLGWQTTSSYYSFTFMRYYEAYSCTFCNKAPDVHTYVTTSLNGYGYQYGNFLIDFNRPSPEPPQPPIAIYYQNVWQVGDYIYHTVSSGIDVYNDNASSIIHHISLANPTAVWADESYVYIGTTNSGVYRSTSSGSASPYKQNPSITSDQTMYLHGSGDNLCVSTRNGVDRFDLQTGDRIYTTVSGVRKCFQTTSGTVYYIEASQFYELDLAALGGVVRDWNYYQVIDFDATPFDDANVGVVLPDTFPFYNTTSTGVDLRFISNNNEVLAYYIQSWYPSALALVSVPVSGTTSFYMIYGNPQAIDMGDNALDGDVIDIVTAATIERDLWDIIKPRLHVVYEPTADWSVPDYTYDEFYVEPGDLQDIHVTSGTIFLGTDRGAHVIEELEGNEINARKKYFFRG